MKVVARWGALPGSVRFAFRAALLMVVFYAILYYPYGESSFPGRVLSQYLAWLARISGWCLYPFDRGVRVDGVFITGRHALQIVLDCAALDALALFAATVLAFPAPIRVKLTGVLAGSAVIWAFNVLRIVILYVAGVKWPGIFDLLHEDVMALLLILVSVGCFAVWAAVALSRKNSAGIIARASSQV